MLELQSASKNGLPAMRLPPASPERSPSDWHPRLHAWAIITMVVAVIAVVLGSLVTSLDVGMVDPDWPTSPWHLLTTQWSPEDRAYLVEHSHRLVDWLIGICVIGLAIGTWLVDSRVFVRWLGPAALVAVLVQGLLGGLRVLLNANFGTELRIMHGCAAHLFVALLGVVVLVTSRDWTLQTGGAAVSKRLRMAAALLVGSLYLQLVFGAVLRHTDVSQYSARYSPYASLAQRGHLLFAMVSVSLATWLNLQVRIEKQGKRKLLYALDAFLGLQLLLGVETWLQRFPSNSLGLPAAAEFNSDLVLRTLHLLIGSLLFASAVMIAVCSYRSVLVDSAVDGTAEGMA
jgi:cytochrome c oxidase assembly protein subunit 15